MPARLMIKARSQAKYDAGKAAVATGTVFGVSGISSVVNHDGSRLLYVEVASPSDLTTLGHELHLRSDDYKVMFHQTSVPTLAELFESNPQVTADAYAAGLIA